MGIAAKGRANVNSIVLRPGAPPPGASVVVLVAADVVVVLALRPPAVAADVVVVSVLRPPAVVADVASATIKTPVKNRSIYMRGHRKYVVNPKIKK